MGMQNNMRKARAFLKNKRNVTIFTGSGASEPSGLPTFSGPESLKDWGVDTFYSNPAWRNELWTLAFETYWDVKQNPAHEAIDQFVADGRGDHITSNVDGLCDGIEVCGNARNIVCADCNAPYNLDAVRDAWLGGDTDMLCKDCDGLLRPDVVLIGETFDLEVMSHYEDTIRYMDALVVIGASELIGTWWVAVQEAYERQIPIVSINVESEPWNEISHVHLNGNAADLTPQLLAGNAT